MVSAKIIDIAVGEKDYIWLVIEYDIDGKKVINKYPLDFKNIIGKTAQEVTDWIDENIKYQMDRYIEATFRTIANTDIVTKTLSSLINREYTKEMAELVTDKIVIIVNTDGTYTKKVV